MVGPWHKEELVSLKLFHQEENRLHHQSMVPFAQVYEEIIH